MALSSPTPLRSIRAPILMYHHVAGPPPGSDGATYISPRRFEAQCAWLRRRGYESISLSALAAALRGEAAPPRRPVVFTFDDAWRDVGETAWPILRAAGFRATVFVVGEGIGERAVAHRESREQAPSAVLEAAQLRELAADGWEIGSHTLTHRHLTRLTREQARREIAAGHEAVERALGGRGAAKVFAYPYGDFHGGAARLAKELGFEAAVVTLGGRLHMPEGRWTLLRLPIARNLPLWRFVYFLTLRPFRRGARELRRRLTLDFPP